MGKLEQLLDRLRDPYWRLDHPEVTAVLLGVITGVIGLLFTWIRIRLIEAPREGA
jgi:hypothetical protein